MLNKELQKMSGTPKNASTGEGGRKTQAESMPAVNGSISGHKFLGGASTYGVGGCSGPASCK